VDDAVRGVDVRLDDIRAADLDAIRRVDGGFGAVERLYRQRLAGEIPRLRFALDDVIGEDRRQLFLVFRL
jgi:hypothetical protein